jgi:hypothetical protein
VFTKLIVGFSFALAMLAPFSVVQAGIDVPGWYDDVSDSRLPAILDVVTFGTLEADFGDMDGDGHVDVVMENDGDLDLVEANSRGENGFLAPQPGQQNRLYINDGSGFFIDESITEDEKHYRLPFRWDNTYDIDLADVDGDGDLDIFAAVREEKNRLLINRTPREMFELYGRP